MFAHNKQPLTPPRTMRAMAVVRENGTGKLAPVERAMLPPQPHEVQIKVAYVGVNRADLLQVEGKYPPPDGTSDIPGLEISGTIVALGNQAVGWSEGEEVTALLSGGGYSEYVNVPAGQLLPIPRALNVKTAASLPEGCATAYMALFQLAGLQANERVLVHGGASGTGILIAQVAHAFGAEVLATVGSEAKCELLYGLGIRPILHQNGAFAEQVMKLTNGEGVHVIIDILGAPALADHFKLLKKGGRLVSLALMEGAIAHEVKISPVLMKNLRWSGGTLRSKTLAEKAEIIHGVRTHIWPHFANHTIRPVTDQVFPLEEAEKAHQRMQERLHLGKILLEVAP